MSEHSKIEWTDATWNPVRGCTKISPGCTHCYAERFAERFRGVKSHPYEFGFDLRLVPEKLCLFVTEPGASGDPLGSSRVTLIGSVNRIPEPELAAARMVYLTRYPDSKYWVDFDDFFFYRMDVLDVYYVSGFGVMGWVAALDYS